MQRRRSLLLFCITFALCLVLSRGNTKPLADSPANFTSPLPTGVRLDPVGDFIDLRSMPMGMALAPEGDKVVVILSGWREQGIQVIDLKSKRVTQTLPQEAAFFGIAFSHDGRTVYASGGNDDSIFCYSWNGTAATFERKIVLGKQKPDKTGSRYPAGIAASGNGKLLYVAENVGDSLAVVNLETSEVVQRIPTDHYPYAVEVASNGKVYASAWGGNTISVLRARSDGTLFFERRIAVGRHPSALLTNRTGSSLFAALGGTDQIAVIDTRTARVLRYLSDAAPGSPAEGSTPNALPLSRDETNLFVAEADNNAVAVFDVSAETPGGQRALHQSLKGRIPTDWDPTAILDSGTQLLVRNGKRHVCEPNPDVPIPDEGHTG